MQQNFEPFSSALEAVDEYIDLSNVDITSAEFIKEHLTKAQKRAFALRCHEQRLHEKTISELLNSSVANRWQAIIEWAFEPELRNSYLKIETIFDEQHQQYHKWWKYPFLKEQTKEEQAQALVKYKSQALQYSSEVLSEENQKWLQATRDTLEAATRHRALNRLCDILNEPGNQLESILKRTALLKDFLLKESAFLVEASESVTGTSIEKESLLKPPLIELKGKPKKLYDFLVQHQGEKLLLLDVYNYYDGNKLKNLTKSQKKIIKNRINELTGKRPAACIHFEGDSVTFSLP